VCAVLVLIFLAKQDKFSISFLREHPAVLLASELSHMAHSIDTLNEQ
jgi:hypothetical protein